MSVMLDNLTLRIAHKRVHTHNTTALTTFSSTVLTDLHTANSEKGLSQRVQISIIHALRNSEGSRTRYMVIYLPVTNKLTSEHIRNK
jgi:hypothetical protein